MDILTFGQYLQPTPAHLEVAEYVSPDKFEHWRRYGEEVVGFRSTLLLSVLLHVAYCCLLVLERARQGVLARVLAPPVGTGTW